MGLDMKITGSDGRSYRTMADMLKAEGQKLIDNHVGSIERAITSQRCSTHGQRARCKVRKIGDRYEFGITACCEDLRNRAQTAASRAAQQ